MGLGYVARRRGAFDDLTRLYEAYDVVYLREAKQWISDFERRFAFLGVSDIDEVFVVYAYDCVIV